MSFTVAIVTFGSRKWPNLANFLILIFAFKAVDSFELHYCVFSLAFCGEGKKNASLVLMF